MAFFGAVRGALERGAGLTSRAARNIWRGGGANAGWGRAIGHDVVRGAAAGMLGMSRMSNVGLSAAMGGVGGGLYGAFSNDTSVLGGALMGAGLGMGALGGARLGAAGARGFRAGYGAKGGGVGLGTSVALRVMGEQSKRFIGAQLSSNGPIGRAAGGIQGLARGVMGRR